MTRKQLAVLFVCRLVPWTAGNGIRPLLPVYAMQLGAAPTVTGFYLSLAYLALTVGTLGGGWLSDRLQSRKKLLVAAGVVTVPATWLMGRATNMWQLTVLTATLWLLGGMILILANILAGLFADKAERGRVFGVLALADPLGLLIGGVASGPIADRWGYPTMFAAFSLLLLLLPLAGLLLQDKPVARPRSHGTPAPSAKSGLGTGFYLLFMASLTVMIANFVSVLGRSLAMQALGFTATAIASTGAMGGAITLPLPPLVGSFSDRLGRKGLLAFSFLAGAMGLSLLSLSASLWHFYVAVSLMYVQNTVIGSVGNAFVTDLVPRPSLGRAISLFNATIWIGGVAGFAITGYAVQNLGRTPTFLIAALLPLASVLLLLPIRPSGKKIGRMAGGS